MCLKHDILATLAYFDIFDYPLTQTEIFQFLGHLHPHKDFTDALDELEMENWIYRFDQYYAIQDYEALSERRRLGNARAKTMLKTARKIAAFLSAFPFVRGVGVSGSLSKNFADENADIDFFIITAPRRLWLARSCMHLFKKLTFLVKKQDWFCMNYYIDEEMMQIPEKNLYTATEVVTLLPLRGIDTFRRFYDSNHWTRDFLPNHRLRVSYVEEVKKPIIKKIFEACLNNFMGSMLDHCLMHITARRWKQKTKTGKLNGRGMPMAMECSRHWAKPDPRNFQVRLLQSYEQKKYVLFRNYENQAKTIY